jgi:hypothetical protein
MCEQAHRSDIKVCAHRFEIGDIVVNSSAELRGFCDSVRPAAISQVIENDGSPTREMLAADSCFGIVCPPRLRR